MNRSKNRVRQFKAFRPIWWRRNCDLRRHQCTTDTAIRRSGSLFVAGSPRSPTFAAGVRRNFCFTRNRPPVGSPLEVVVSVPVNPQVRALLDEFEKQGLPPFEQMSPTQARLVAMGFRDLQGEPEDVAEVRDILVPGPAGALPVRLYHPSPGKSPPLVVYFHGGGWVIGDIEIVDPCRALANASQCVVASVNYRIRPERNSPGRSRIAILQRGGWRRTRKQWEPMVGLSPFRVTVRAAIWPRRLR